MSTTTIKTYGDFELVYQKGVGINDTPYEELYVISKGLAKKHVIEVRLDSYHSPRFEGEPVKYIYHNVYVSHGMRCVSDSLVETKEYIDVLKDALDVAFEVQKYCMLNGWWK